MPAMNLACYPYQFIKPIKSSHRPAIFTGLMRFLPRLTVIAALVGTGWHWCGDVVTAYNTSACKFPIARLPDF
ncbi:hypothetical protein RY831_31615 [Noviherbaspirillum sp. CPCC 100848]|uniref:DUF4184 family protein n=1 Tax=Noviherbaspirillum album TaxID=3080276 RepID=A0ABU6JJI6_9BURK|nr:hypothetical protein [Noviherbaspirillum sp. CPCC 100848]MEC4723673.1 hypothetical protein [Noviherbaspirillum sp. CPCC 100848]